MEHRPSGTVMVTRPEEDRTVEDRSHPPTCLLPVHPSPTSPTRHPHVHSRARLPTWPPVFSPTCPLAPLGASVGAGDSMCLPAPEDTSFVSVNLPTSPKLRPTGLSCITPCPNTHFGQTHCLEAAGRQCRPPLHDENPRVRLPAPQATPLPELCWPPTAGHGALHVPTTLGLAPLAHPVS